MIKRDFGQKIILKFMVIFLMWRSDSTDYIDDGQNGISVVTGLTYRTHEYKLLE